MNIKPPPRISLANLPTRIEKLERLSTELEGPEIYIKRDDLTECGASGNKIRKLEFLVAHALEKGCDTLITCGWVHSNHARATAIIGAKLGLSSILILRGEKPKELCGNIFLDRLAGARIKYVDKKEYEKRDELMDEIARKLAKKGRKAYTIPSGGSNETGIWGYIMAAQEIKEQLKKEELKINAIIIPVGTGGTYTGLLIGKVLFNLSPILYGINVEKNGELFKSKIYELVKKWESKYGIEVKISKEDIKIIDGYVGRGYGLSRPEERETIKFVARKEGVLLDPVYTGKSMHGLIQEIKKGRFKKGEKILFIHTGGIFGLLGTAKSFRFP